MTTATIADQVAVAFPFDVSKLPLAGPENLKTPHYGLFRDDSGACVGVAVRKGYEPHTTDDVVALAEAASVGFDATCEVKAGFDAGHRVVIGPSRERRASIFGTNDNIFPRFILRAGYDGRAFTASLGMYRDACDNLMMITPAGQRHSLKLRHTFQLRERMPELIETFRNLAASWSGIVATAERLQATEIDFTKFIRDVYPASADASRRSERAADRRAELIIRRVVRERLKTNRDSSKKVTAWEALNAITGYVQHDKSRKGSPTRFDRALRSLDDADTRRATELALAS